MDVIEAEASASGTDATIVTTTELVAITADAVTIPRDGAKVLVIAWAQIGTGAAATALTPRIRRGSAITDTLVDEANPQTAAASVNERVFMVTVDEAPGGARTTYSLTVQQTAATGNGTVQQAGIAVLVLG